MSKPSNEDNEDSVIVEDEEGRSDGQSSKSRGRPETEFGEWFNDGMNRSGGRSTSPRWSGWRYGKGPFRGMTQDEAYAKGLEIFSKLPEGEKRKWNPQSRREAQLSDESKAAMGINTSAGEKPLRWAAKAIKKPAAKQEEAKSSGITLDDVSPDGGASSTAQGATSASLSTPSPEPDATRVSGGNFSIVKPEAKSAGQSVADYFSPQRTTALDRVAQRSVDRGFGQTKTVIGKGFGTLMNGDESGETASRGGRTTVETGPWQDKSLPPAVRQRMWEKRNAPPDKVVTAGDGLNADGSNRSFDEDFDKTYKPARNADGSLMNPAKDMATQMNYHKRDGTILQYSRETAKGVPAPMRLTSAKMPENTQYDENSGKYAVTTNATDSGAKTTEYRDVGKNLGSTGDLAYTVKQDGQGRSNITDASGRVMGRMSISPRKDYEGPVTTPAPVETPEDAINKKGGKRAVA